MILAIMDSFDTIIYVFIPIILYELLSHFHKKHNKRQYEGKPPRTYIPYHLKYSKRE